MSLLRRCGATLEFKDLLLMAGERVVCVDRDVRAYDSQAKEPILLETICTVSVLNTPDKKQFVRLENEDYLFDFDTDGNCCEGEFEVYMIG